MRDQFPPLRSVNLGHRAPHSHRSSISPTDQSPAPRSARHSRTNPAPQQIPTDRPPGNAQAWRRSRACSYKRANPPRRHTGRGSGGLSASCWSAWRRSSPNGSCSRSHTSVRLAVRDLLRRVDLVGVDVENVARRIDLRQQLAFHPDVFNDVVAGDAVGFADDVAENVEVVIGRRAGRRLLHPLAEGVDLERDRRRADGHRFKPVAPAEGVRQRTAAVHDVGRRSPCCPMRCK